MRASALAYTSLLSMVPLLAVMFSILKGLGVQRRIEPLLLSRLSLNEQTAEAIVGYIDRTNVATLGALGAALLLISVVSLLGSIEASFNQVWRVTRSRTVWRKIADYSGVVMLTPFLLLVAVTLTSSLQIQEVVDWLGRSAPLDDVMVLALQCASALINAVALVVLYAVMPNRRPYFPGILLSGLIAGAAWQVVQWLYVELQVGVASYNAIYGAMSQIPVTLVWLYVSWLIVLYGAEIASVIEFGAEISAMGSPHEGAIALHVLLEAVAIFRRGGGCIDPLLTAHRLQVDPEVVLRVCERLREWRWLGIQGDEPARYLLLRDPASLELARLAELHAGTIPRGCSVEARQLLGRIALNVRDAWNSVSISSADSGEKPDSAS